MSIPAATYRLQFGHGFGFRQAADAVPYLASLGVSHVYASPLLAGLTGGHGYDTVDPSRLSPELGTAADFEAFWSALRGHAMGLVLDIVPNHMAADPDQNPWWRDVLARGRRSRFAGWFDAEWDAPGLDGRVLVPVLGAPLEDVLAAGELTVDAVGPDGEPAVRYFERTFPIAPGTATRADLAAARRDPGALAALLDRQPYRLAHWRIGNERINWRRFFDISSLVAVRQEVGAVFDATHRLVLRLVARGRSDGVPVALRVDHVDGLADPDAYLARLRDAAGPETHIVVEKILARGEQLPASWPVAGESGYAFLDAADGLFVDPDGVAALAEAPVRAGGEALLTFDELCRDGKRLVLTELFGAERERVTRLASRAASASAGTSDIGERDLRDALVALTAALPVYRTYLRPGLAAGTGDRRLIHRAARDAIGSSPSPSLRRAVRFLRDTMLSAATAGADPEPHVAELVRRWQQLCPAVTAKGVEDTALYRDPRVPSRAEVGSNPGAPVTTVDAFHSAMRRRRERWPGAMSTTSTHDTKRSEDARARLHVLSEIPDAWLERVERWHTWNAHHRRRVDGRDAPDPTEELTAYHALLALWPASGWRGVDRTLVERLQRHVVKSAREAKVHTDWLAPVPAYERALRAFVASVTASRRSRFAEDLAPFAGSMSFHGALNALAATVLTITAPGFPDVYQGSELWDPRLVDPDNRAPVDLAGRTARLAAIDAASVDVTRGIPALMERWQDGGLKLLVLSRALRFRRRQPGLFACGRYVPLRVRGRQAEHAVAFARRSRADWAVAVVPRLTVRLTGASVGSDPSWPVGRAIWGSTAVVLPSGAPTRWRDALTGGAVAAPARARDGERVLRLADLLSQLPVSVLSPEA